MRRNSTQSSLVCLAVLGGLLVTGCASNNTSPGTSNRTQRGGGYYMDDGPGTEPAPDHRQIPDAQPRREPLLARANRPYVVFGRSYQPMTALVPYKERGIASWYGQKFHGRKTSSGEIYDMYAMTAAHPTLPIPSYVRVTRVTTGQQIVVRVNDRGPFLNNRVIDLSYTAAAKLDYVNAGSAQVEVELIAQPDRVPPTTEVLASNSAVPASPPSPPAAVAIPINRSGGGNTAAGTASGGTNIEFGGARIPAANELNEERLQIETTIVPPLAPGVAPAEVPAQPASPAPAPTPATPAKPSSSSAPSGQQKAASSEGAQPTARNQAKLAPRTYLQLGAFSSRENAESTRVRVQQQLDWLEPPIEMVADGRMFKLQAGPLNNRDDANAIAEKIRATTGSKPFALVR